MFLKKLSVAFAGIAAVAGFAATPVYAQSVTLNVAGCASLSVTGTSGNTINLSCGSATKMSRWGFAPAS